MYKILKLLRTLAIFFVLLAPWSLKVKASADPNMGIEEFVRLSFAETPVMIGVAKCESGFKQFRADGSVLHGGATGQYTGIFQIDSNIHTNKAVGMGFDINTIPGNINYAHYLYNSSGSGPWKGCLGNSTVVAPSISTSTSSSVLLTLNLNSGMSNPQVKLVQQILNKNGFQIAATGPGSPGSETAYFGMLTRDAVRRFQCAKAIVCGGNESTTGYGRVGPKTRSILNQM